MPTGAQIGVRAVFEDAGVEQRVNGFNKRMESAERATQKLEKSSIAAARGTEKAFATAEKAAERLDKVIRGLGASAQPIAQVSESFRRAFTSAGQFEGVYRRMGAAGDDRMAKIAQRTKEAEDAVVVLADVTEDTEDRRSKASEKANRAMMSSLRNLRWETVTILFFIRMAGIAFRSAFEMMAESAERASQRIGVAALARVLSADARSIVLQMRSVSDETLSMTQAFTAAQAGMLADQGRFADSYASFWQAARVAAVTGGGDVTRIFTAIIGAVNGADASMLDSVTSAFQAQNALIAYATSSGRLLSQLSEQERRQVILNTVQERTNELLDAGAQAALDAREPLDKLKASWDDLKSVVESMVELQPETVAFFNSVAERISDSAASITAMDEALRSLLAGMLLMPSTALKRSAEVYTKSYREVFQVGAPEPPTTGIAGRERPPGAAGVATAAVEDELRRRMQIAELMEPILERIFDTINAHNRRVESVNRDHIRTLARMERDHLRDLDRIDRRAARSREKAIRDNNKRMEQAAKETIDRIAEMMEQHNLQMIHMEQTHSLQMSNSEAMYQYNRRKLIADGDSLAIQDLDARHELEVDAQNAQYNLQRQQAEEMFKLQLKYAQQAAQEQVRALRDGLRDQLDEIEQQRRDERDESELRYGEQLGDAEDAHADQLVELEDALREQMDTIGRGLASQKDVWNAGYQEILELIRQVFGAGGTADAIITAFLARMSQIGRITSQYMRTGTMRLPAPARMTWMPGGIPTEVTGFQYGGEGIATHPELHMIGEHGAERYSYQPVGAVSGAMSISWAGPPIEVHGTGTLAGSDMSGVADALSRNMFIELTKLHNTLRGQRGR